MRSMAGRLEWSEEEKEASCSCCRSCDGRFLRSGCEGLEGEGGKGGKDGGGRGSGGSSVGERRGGADGRVTAPSRDGYPKSEGDHGSELEELENSLAIDEEGDGRVGPRRVAAVERQMVDHLQPHCLPLASQHILVLVSCILVGNLLVALAP